MSHETVLHRSRLFAAAAAAASTAGLLTAPVAQAEPMFPLAPACQQYKFIGDFALQQSNGYRVEFSSNSQAASGRATATGGNGSKMYGDVSGGVNGRNVDFTIRWDGGGAQGHYTGTIDDFDFVKGGTTVDEKNPGSRASWDSTVPFGCADAPPVQKPPQTNAGKTATVVGEDVDVYNIAHGDDPDPETGVVGVKIGVLRVGDVVQLPGLCQPNDWCKVNSSAIQGGTGFVWGHLQFN